MSAPRLYWHNWSDSAVVSLNIVSPTTIRDGWNQQDVLHLDDTTGFVPGTTFGFNTLDIDNGEDLTANRIMLVMDLRDVTETLKLTLSVSDDDITYTPTLSNEEIHLVNGVAKFSFGAGAPPVPLIFRYWRVTIGFGLLTTSPWILHHICIDNELDFPFLAEDPNKDDITPGVEPLISRNGLMLGTSQNKKEHKMVIDWGDLTLSELINVQTWADDIIKTPQQFFFQPDEDEDDIYYGYLENGGKWATPLEDELYLTPPNNFTARII